MDFSDLTPFGILSMTSEPIPGQGKRRRRRRRKGGGGNAPAINTPAQGSRRAQEDDAGISLPERKPVHVDFDLVARDCLQARHLEIFEWLKRTLGKSSEELIREFVRGAVVKERVAYHEAQGHVSMSARDLETLKNR